MFKKDDQVICVRATGRTHALTQGATYKVKEVHQKVHGTFVRVNCLSNELFNVNRFAPVPEAQSPKPEAIDQHAPGAKLDQGKVRPSLVLQGMPRAILKVSEVATFGANKYSDGGWLHVANGQQRYTDAQLRHFLKQACGEEKDSESEVDHLAHEAWNALARLELKLREQENAPANKA